MKVSYQSYQLKFKTPGGTSRGILTEKETFLLKLKTGGDNAPEFFGECGLFRGLSADDIPRYEEKLNWVCNHFFEMENEEFWEGLREFPSIQFGIEQIVQARKNYDKNSHDDFNPLLFPSDFTSGKEGITINGLIWMGTVEFMRKQIIEKLNQNFHCIKIKIGMNWDEEFEILKNLRKEFSENELELRVDANGAFDFDKAKAVLEELAKLKIHSIEQPIKAGNPEQMAELCESAPTPIALDEELIGVFYLEQKQKLLEIIKPQYIILKPSLVGGWKGSSEWIDFAEQQNTGWWITSALESNIGLNAIAQWTYTLNNKMPQGLGTGGLFENNFYSRLKLKGDRLYFV